MSDNYSVSVVAAALTSTTTDWSETVTADTTHTEEFRGQINLLAGASDTSLTLTGLTAPKIVVVEGATGVSFKIGSGGTDSIPCDPVAVFGNEDDGHSVTELLFSNSDSSAHTVKIYSFQ
jgi:hypothetical protein